MAIHPFQVQEIRGSIFSFLNLGNDLTAVALTCKLWRNSLNEINFLYRFLENRKCITYKTLSKIKKLFFAKHAIKIEDQQILNLCSNLKKLDLKRSTSLTSLEYSSATTTEIDLSYNHNLCQIPLKGYPALTRLNLSYTSITDQFFEDNRLSQIEFLKLEGCSKLENPSFEDCVNVKEIDLAKCKKLYNPVFNHLNLIKLSLFKCEMVIQPTMKNLNSLTSLDFSNNNFSEKDLNNFLKIDLPRIETLRLGNIHGITKIGLTHPTLKEINLSACFNLEEFNVNGLTRLETLSLVACKIYDEAIQKLSIYSLNSLKKLDVSHCHQLKNPQFEHLSLNEITLNWCRSLKNPKFKDLPNLEFLSMQNNSNSLAPCYENVPKLAKIDTSMNNIMP